MKKYIYKIKKKEPGFFYLELQGDKESKKLFKAPLIKATKKQLSAYYNELPGGLFKIKDEYVEKLEKLEGAVKELLELSYEAPYTHVNPDINTDILKEKIKEIKDKFDLPEKEIMALMVLMRRQMKRSTAGAHK